MNLRRWLTFVDNYARRSWSVNFSPGRKPGQGTGAGGGGSSCTGPPISTPLMWSKAVRLEQYIPIFFQLPVGTSVVTGVYCQKYDEITTGLP